MEAHPQSNSNSNSVLDLDHPGLELSNHSHKPVIDKLSYLAQDIFGEINNQQKNNSQYNLKKKQFYGAHPVSLEKKHFKELKEQHSDFIVCEKTDGTRYLMYINNRGEVYLSGRGEGFHLVNIPMPTSMISSRDKDIYLMYVFDGEVVIDERNGTKTLMYYFFDCIMFKNYFVFDKRYIERLKDCQQFVSRRSELIKSGRDYIAKPYNKFIQPEEREKQPLIEMCVKDFYPIEASGYIYNSIVPTLPHKNDGLIYTRNSKPYSVGATSNIVKWKPPEHNTIDFIIVNNVKWEAEYGKTVLDLYVGQFNKQTRESEDILFDVMVLDEAGYNKIAETLGIKSVEDTGVYKSKKNEERKKVIAECRFDTEFSSEALTKLLQNYSKNPEDFITSVIKNSVFSEGMSEREDVREGLRLCFEKKVKTMKGGWVITRVRTDKIYPNASTTARGIFNCIFEDISIEDVDKELNGTQAVESDKKKWEKIKLEKEPSGFNKGRPR